jgi:hypothetical protein
VFDHGNQNGRYLAKGYSAACKSNPAYGQWGMPPEIAFEKRQTAAPLQAADLLAWETGKFADNTRRGIVRFRRSFERVAKLPGRSWVVTGRELWDFELYYLQQSILKVMQRAA